MSALMEYLWYVSIRSSVSVHLLAVWDDHKLHNTVTSYLESRDLQSFEVWFEFESAVPIWFDSKVVGGFENFWIGCACPLLIVVKQLKPLTALSGSVYRLASSVSDHTPVLFNICLRSGMKNLYFCTSLFVSLIIDYWTPDSIRIMSDHRGTC